MATDAPSASLSFDIRFMKKGKHSVILFLPEAYHAPIGLVIAYWGNFETVFNACLGGLIEAEQNDGGTRDTTAWKHRRFKSRRELFKELCSEWLAGKKPEVATLIAEMADRAGDLSWKRNMIAHGAYSYEIPPMSSGAVNCRAIDHEKGKEFPFDETVLKRLYHDISHLTADLVAAFSAIGKVEGPFHALPDTEILRVYRETSHPWNPNPKKRISLPPSSEE